MTKLLRHRYRLFNTPRTATIRAVSFCDLFVLARYVTLAHSRSCSWLLVTANRTHDGRLFSDDLEALMKDFPARAAKIYQASLNRYKHDSSMHTAAIRQYLSQWVREEEEGHMMLCVCVELTARVPTVQESNPELQHRPKRRQSESGASGKPDFSRSASQPVSRMKRETLVEKDRPMVRPRRALLPPPPPPRLPARPSRRSSQW